MCDKGQIHPESEPGVEEHPRTTSSMMRVDEQASHADGEESIHQDEVKSTDVVLEYSDATREDLQALIPSTFKLLWDGTLSPLPPSVTADSAHALLTNKLFVERLLDLRVNSQNDDEPPVTLLHGSETETVVRASLLRVKLEQQEAQEEAKRLAKLGPPAATSCTSWLTSSALKSLSSPPRSCRASPTGACLG
jgi:hypothetical protein